MGPNDPMPVDWRGLTAAEPEALAAASTEVEVFVRALAAYGVIFDPDGLPSELEDRQNTIRAKLWPAQPLDGFGLHASLGAFLVTKVAVDLVPTGHLGLRPEHLSPEGLVKSLTDQGLAYPAARAITGDWPGEPEGFVGDHQGLPMSVLAGLAARTLTRDERHYALAQVAASPRDAARLAAATSLLLATRQVLPLLPVPPLGPVYDIAVVGLSVGRGDRVAALLRAPEDVLQAALKELGEASAALSVGEAYAPGVDRQVCMPLSSQGPWDDEQTDPAHGLDVEGALRRACRWRAATAPQDVLEAFDTTLWRCEKGALGLRWAVPAPTVVAFSVPPDASLVGGLSDTVDLEGPPFAWRDDALDAIAPVVRGAVRVVAAAAEGEAPPPLALERAGGLEWLVRRAAALAAVVRGDLSEAIEMTEPLPSGSTPERRWAQDRRRRYGGRDAEPVAPQDARPMAAALVGDLAHQFARTVTGTVPQERHE